MSLTDEEQDRYQWQTWTEGFGAAGQEKLKAASVLVSRVGGVGGTVAMHLAAAGIGKLILAHGGELRRNDMNRQMLMSTSRIGDLRVDQARDRLLEINPNVEVVTVAENVSADNAEQLISEADVVASAAPLFQERLAMNAAAVQQRKFIAHCAMYDMEASVLTTVPGQTACLACITPEPPAWWKREFPVFGAVSGTAGSIAAMEIIKHIASVGEPADGMMTVINFRTGHFRKVRVARDPACPVCGSLS